MKELIPINKDFYEEINLENIKTIFINFKCFL